MWLISKRTEVAHAVAAVGEHHHQVAQDLSTIMGRPPLLARQHRFRQAPRQAKAVGQVAKGEAAHVVGDALAILGHDESLWTVAGTLATLHLRSALLERVLRRRTPQVSQFRRAILL